MHTKTCKHCYTIFEAPHGNFKFCSNSCYKENMNKRDKFLKAGSSYAISGEEYERCMNTSDVCEIWGGANRLCYDHNHTTMKFRGVLCAQCNKGLGNLGDNKEGLIKALMYLLRSEDGK